MIMHIYICSFFQIKRNRNTVLAHFSWEKTLLHRAVCLEENLPECHSCAFQLKMHCLSSFPMNLIFSWTVVFLCWPGVLIDHSCFVESVLKANQSAGILSGPKPSAKDLTGDVPRNQSSADMSEASGHNRVRFICSSVTCFLLFDQIFHHHYHHHHLFWKCPFFHAKLGLDVCPKSSPSTYP